MDIEEFIEQDILVYLDRRLEKDSHEDIVKQASRVTSVYLTRDYEKEMRAALESDNVVKAKKVLHDLKKKFDEIPPGTSDKQDVKTLLAHLYEEFRTHIGAEKISHKEFRPVPPPPSAEPPVEDAPAGIDVPPEPAGEAVVAMEAVRVLAEAKTKMLQDDLKGAVQSYREAKRAALSMDTPVPDELALQFKQVFDEIRQRLKGQSHIPPVQPVQEASLDEDLLVQLEREKKHLDEELKQDDLDAADATYRNMKMIVQQMQDHARAERAAEKLIAIKSIIEKMRAHHNDRQMVRQVP